jgi:hypothetical protein
VRAGRRRRWRTGVGSVYEALFFLQTEKKVVGSVGLGGRV